MTIHWPYHLQIHPEETKEAWVQRGENAIRGLYGTDAGDAILDFLEGLAGDHLHQANKVALANPEDKGYMQEVAKAQALQEAARRLDRLVHKEPEPTEAVEKRARTRLDHRRRSASQGVMYAR